MVPIPRRRYGADKDVYSTNSEVEVTSDVHFQPVELLSRCSEDVFLLPRSCLTASFFPAPEGRGADSEQAGICAMACL